MFQRFVTYCPHWGMANQIEQLLSAAHACNLLNATLILPPFVCDHLEGPKGDATASSWADQCYSMLTQVEHVDIYSFLDLGRILKNVPHVSWNSGESLQNMTVVEVLYPVRGQNSQNTLLYWKRLQNEATLHSEAHTTLFKFGSTFHMFQEVERKGLAEVRFSTRVVTAGETILKHLKESFDCAHIRTGSSFGWDGVVWDLLNKQHVSNPHFSKRLKETLELYAKWANKLQASRPLIVSTDSKLACEQSGVSSFRRVLYIEDLLGTTEEVYPQHVCQGTFDAALSVYICSKAMNFFATKGSHLSRLISALKQSA